jgi:hypothetical protein
MLKGEVRRARSIPFVATVSPITLRTRTEMHHEIMRKQREIPMSFTPQRGTSMLTFIACRSPFSPSPSTGEGWGEGDESPYTLAMSARFPVKTS